MKILLVTSRYPWPPRRGDQIRAVQSLDILAAEHEVTLLTPESDEAIPPPDAPYRIEHYKPVRTALASGLARVLARGLPLQSALFYQPDLGRKLRELAPRADLGILQLVRLAVHLDDFGTTPILADLIDSLALNTARRAEVDHPLLRPALRYEAHLLDKAERRLAERAAGVLLVCERDRQDLVNRWPPDLGRKVAVVRLAVSVKHGHPEGEPCEREGSGGREDSARPLLAITGNLGYFVNVDAVTWWLREVWPPLHKTRPDVRVVIAGDRPSGAVRRAVAKAGVELIESPPDLRSIIASASLSLAPMRSGSGVPIKILEAWAVGTPVVATAWAAAGTTGKPGEDFLVAGSHPAEWASAIRELLDDPAARARLAGNGRRRLLADYSTEVVREQLLGAVAVVLEDSAPGAPSCRAGEPSG